MTRVNRIAASSAMVIGICHRINVNPRASFGAGGWNCLSWRITIRNKAPLQFLRNDRTICSKEAVVLKWVSVKTNLGSAEPSVVSQVKQQNSHTSNVTVLC